MTAFGPITTKVSDAYGARIYMAGDYDRARQTLREYCSTNGACFSIHPMDYIYSGGEETGFCVTLINYPRFRKPKSDIITLAREIGTKLMEDLNQSSYTIEGYGSEIDPYYDSDIDQVITSQAHFISRRK